MTDFKGFCIDDIIRCGRITDSDAIKLRTLSYADRRISFEEADILFKLNDANLITSRLWNDFFIEVITGFIVDQAEPVGYVTAQNTAWLMERISHDGKVNTRTEFELAINILDRARWAPESLVKFTLGHVRDAVISGDGILRDGLRLKPGTIAEAEVELLRRILYAFGGDGNVAITRAEAEVLFEINDAVLNENPNPAWTDLFIKAIANAVMTASSYAVPIREEALRRDAWLDYRGDLSPNGMVKKLLADGFSLGNGYRPLTREESVLDRLERQRVELIVNEKVTEGESAWLAERIGRDGCANANEAALLAYLHAECPDMHPDLQTLVERHASAA